MNTDSTIRAAVERYLTLRRRLGFELRFTGQQLMRFAKYADARGHHGPLTLELQLGWAREHVKRTGPVTWARRLEVVGPFAAYYRQFEPGTEIPDLHTFGAGHRRLAPHIYTEQEVCDLLEQAGRLPPWGGVRPATYRTLFGLIATAGLRLSEALNLRDGDVDLRHGNLTVRHTKLNKSRCLPLHSSAVQALNEYRQLRDRHVEARADMPFFVSPSGCALSKRTVENVFDQLRRQLGWRARGGHPQPRIQDLRHSFAVARLRRWYEMGKTVDHAVLWLCTYLGHASISDTYWYLSGTLELMSAVGAKFESFALEGCLMPSSNSPTFSGLVQEFFTDYMVQQRALSLCTVASYRDAFLLMLRFAEQHLGKPPSALQLADIDAKFLASFLEHLERDRHNTVRSRNIRLAAIR